MEDAQQPDRRGVAGAAVERRPVGERATDEETDNRIWELAVTGLSSRQIARALRSQGVEISYATVTRRIDERAKEVHEQTDDLVKRYRAKHLAALDAGVVEAFKIARSTACRVCRGEGTIARDKLDPDLGRQTCPRCEGDGKDDNATTRLSALNTLRGLLERQARLAGLDAPERHELGTPGSLDWTERSDAEIERELEGLLGRPALQAAVDSTAVDVVDESPPVAASATDHGYDRAVTNGGFG